MKVLVLKGGDSSERDVSLRSAACVVDALKSAGHEVLEYDTAEGLDGMKQFSDKADVVFPILHGKDGEDGTVQAKLEAFDMKYLGATSSVSKLCFDKAAFKQAVKKLGVKVPAGEIVTRETIETSKLTKSPFVLKPNDGGSSIDTYIVRNPSDTALDLNDIFSRHTEMLAEELITGVEITVPVLDRFALPVIEIIPPEGSEFDYENKYNGKTQELCPPENIDSSLQKQAQEIAEKIHTSLGVRHLSRTDIIIDDDHEMYVLELNTIPGMTDKSLFPKSADVNGMSMQFLVESLLGLTLES